MATKHKAARAPSVPKQVPARSVPTKEELLGFYGLLKGLEPTDDHLDLVWQGPLWIAREGVWHPTSFLLYKGILHGSIHLPSGGAMMEGDIRTGHVEWIDIDRPGWPPGSESWPRAFPALAATLRDALGNLEEYNREVERDMPLACRTGKLTRRLTWRKGEEPVPAERIAAARAAARSAAAHTPLPMLSTSEYLRVAEIAYDAAFPEERALPRDEKHRRHADKRHGGMLDLPPDDADAFKEWFTSYRWEGAHPFEIVYGYPHGVVFWPDLKNDGWRFRMSASDELYHPRALEMIIALDRTGIPVEFPQAESILRTLEGTDDVEIGPYRGQMSLAEVRKKRPGSVSAIRWDPLPELAPVTEDGRARIAWVEEHGNMAGFESGPPSPPGAG